MRDNDRLLRVAAVQAAPEFLDRDRTVEKACSLIREAGRNGARLIMFGEGFLPGHPVWFHFFPVTHPRSIELSSALVENAVSIPGPETERLGEAAREAGATVVLGLVERPGSQTSVIYDTQLVIGPDGSIAGRRRKLVPAVGERIVFTAGAGDSIRVFEAPWGPTSALLGGENANPLLTYTLRSLGARVHIAAWPPHFNKPGLMGEVMAITGRAIAYQNSCHVIAVAGATSRAAIDRLAPTDEQRELLESMAADPGSAIYAPRGALLAGPLGGGEGILYGELDLGQGVWAQLVNRQYDRPDLLRVVVDRAAAAAGVEFDPGSAESPGSSARGLGPPIAPPGEIGDPGIRRMIVDRFGDRLTANEVEELMPYVRGILQNADRLAALELGGDDPRRVEYVEDLRLLE